MAGIYIHIPFCKTRCIYCDFYSNTSMRIKAQFLDALCTEITARASELSQQNITTLYFGGGTPSQLSPSDWERIFEALGRSFCLDALTEVTLEANPDDLSPSYIQTLRKFPFNRISIGIQTFDSEKLRLLNRRHNQHQAIEAVRQCQTNGFDNISIDLMYGLPQQTLEQWQQDLEIALSLDVQHISSYHLIYEPDTELYKRYVTGQLAPVDDTLSVQLFETLIHTLKEAGYTHYEISNFAKPSFCSQHNSSYWKGIPYLGLGPSAHSFDGENRHFNPSSLSAYIQNPLVRNTEQLSADEKYNDLILTAIRTHWGLDLNEVARRFGQARRAYCLEMAQPFLQTNKLRLEKDTLYLTEAGIFISDAIMSEMMFD